MGAYLVFLGYGIPCLLFLIFILTPQGKRWLEKH